MGRLLPISLRPKNSIRASVRSQCDQNLIESSQQSAILSSILFLFYLRLKSRKPLNETRQRKYKY
uniref:Uncharacterized protein n=1 Tax=Arundo donax TaxID=35708 RepID=A0A0A9HB28_ARUDO